MQPDKVKIGLIVLAAGSSRRMRGTAKQTLVVGGKSLLRRAAELAAATEFFPKIVVLGKDFEKLKAEIADLPVKAVFNSDFALGVSSSIKTGLRAVSAPMTDALIVMLCDQPLLTTENLFALRDSFLKNQSLIVASVYENTTGVPALFSRAVFDDLMNLENDEGAKKIIKKYRAEAVFIFAPEAALDVDTPEDYEKLKNYKFT